MSEPTVPVAENTVDLIFVAPAENTVDWNAGAPNFIGRVEVRPNLVVTVNSKLRRLANISPKDLVNTAKHEAGHAIITKLCGAEVFDANLYALTERASGSSQGDIHHDHIYDDYKDLMVSVAGLAGELIDDDSPRPFYRSKLDHDLHGGTRGDASNIDRRIFDHPIYQGSVQVHPDFDYVAWANEAFYQSHRLLRQFRSVFDEVVALLLEKKQLTRDELRPILAKLPRKAPRSKLFTWSTTRKAIEELEKSNPTDPRLNLYKAAKRAQEMSTVYTAQRAMEEAKKVYDAAKKASDEAQQEIQYMLRNSTTLVEAKRHFLVLKQKSLEALQAELKRHRLLPWQQRNWQWMSSQRSVIKSRKDEIAAQKAEIKALLAAKVAA